MAEAEALWTLLEQTGDPVVAAALKSVVAQADDRSLNRINPIAFAASHGLDEGETIRTLVHSAQHGLFDMAWSAVCPGCGGVLEIGSALRTLNRPEYLCAFCRRSDEPTLDERVEVTFTVNPRIRRIAGHEPDTLPPAEYLRQIFWSSGVDLPADFEAILERVTLDIIELEPGERATMSLTLPPGHAAIFDPVTHTTVHFDVAGEETHERRNLSALFTDEHAHANAAPLRPGPVRFAFENRSKRRALPGVWLATDEMFGLSRKRRPFLSATGMFTNQTFRDLYRSGTIDSEQRFKITNLTILFTDLRGSTALYDRVGDLAAFDLVRDHFGALIATISAEGGAVVKTIGDAVMATFPTPDRALRAAIAMREDMDRINAARGREELALNIGLHEGPCLAVLLDDRQDYFGQTVNIASRVQKLADPSAILATRPIVESAEVKRLLAERGYRTDARQAALRGVSEALTIYEIREQSPGAAAA